MGFSSRPTGGSRRVRETTPGQDEHHPTCGGNGPPCLLYRHLGPLIPLATVTVGGFHLNNLTLVAGNHCVILKLFPVMWVRWKLHLHYLLNIVLGWRPVGILNNNCVEPANHSFPRFRQQMPRIFIPMPADSSRYPTIWTVTGLAIGNRLRWVLGHAVANFGLVEATSLENFVQLS